MEHKITNLESITNELRNIFNNVQVPIGEMLDEMRASINTIGNNWTSKDGETALERIIKPYNCLVSIYNQINSYLTKMYAGVEIYRQIQLVEHNISVPTIVIPDFADKRTINPYSLPSETYFNNTAVIGELNQLLSKNELLNRCISDLKSSTQTISDALQSSLLNSYNNQQTNNILSRFNSFYPSYVATISTVLNHANQYVEVKIEGFEVE